MVRLTPHGRITLWSGILGLKNHLQQEYWVNAEMIDIKNYEICQYTGVKDKHGALIYEGDIVINPFNKKGMLVKWGWHNLRDCCGQSFGGFSLQNDFEYYEIIGNRFQHPELLESKE